MNATERAATHAAKIMAHAQANYDKGGWDVIVEGWTTTMIADNLVENNITTYREALKHFRFAADVWADRQADARNSAF